MPNVFVPQRQTSFDLTPARRFGSLITLFDQFDLNDASQLYVDKVRDVLEREYCPDDHLLMAGDMVLICVMFKMMADMSGGSVRCLKWDRMKKEYYSLLITELNLERIEND